ncbi:sensor histidine kinase [Chloroflexota bacterium]
MNTSQSIPSRLEPWLHEILSFNDNALAMALGIFDTAGHLRYANASMQLLLGSEEHGSVADTFKSPTFASLLEKQPGQTIFYQGWLTFGSQSTPHRSVRGSVFRQEQELLVIAEYDVEELDRVNRQIMEINQDITNLQRELARRNAELGALNERKNEFMGIAAHDLRSPLTVIKGNASLLTMYPEMPVEERLDILNMITGSVTDMVEMLNKLLNVSEIEAGKLEIAPVEIDIYEYFHLIAQKNRHLADQKDIAIHLNIEPGLPPVQFDPHRIQQVMHNLLSNAFKFSYPNTQVVIRIVRTNSHIEVSVIDEGKGIKPDELDKVFLAFQRTSTKATAGEHSTGLGLAICKRIITLSGGEIGVESNFGQGSRFFSRYQQYGNVYCRG